MAKKLSPMEQRASSKVLGDLRGTAQEMMKGKMDKLKKVTVASDSKQGLKKGLSIAEKVLAGEKADDEEACPECAGKGGECECYSTDDHEADDELSHTPGDSSYAETDGDTNPDEDMTDDEIDARIEELLKIKSRK